MVKSFPRNTEGFAVGNVELAHRQSPIGRLNWRSFGIHFGIFGCSRTPGASPLRKTTGEAVAEAKRAEAERKAVAEAQKIVAICNARQAYLSRTIHWAYGDLLAGQSAERVVTMRWTSRIAISLVLLIVAGVARSGNEDEVKALFAKFVAAQNAHDLKTVSELLQHSPRFLWITRGVPVWGDDAALQRFQALYQGTWSLDPKIDELKVIELQPGVAQIYVPITFMISPVGQAAQPTRFLMNLVAVKTADGWKVSSILPIPAPQS
jgi:uncharacterized protein (TIGR02246 family)